MFTLTTVTGQSIVGDVKRFDLKNQLVFLVEDRDEDLVIAAADVVSLQRNLRQRPYRRPAMTFHLAGGDRLVGVIVAAADEILAIENPALGAPAKVALVDLEALGTFAAGKPAWQDRVRTFFALSRDEEDRVLLANGDVLPGLVAAVDARGLEIEVGQTVRRLDYDAVIAAALVAAPVGDRRAGMFARVSLDDGTVISVTDLRWRAGTGLRVRFAGEELEVLPERVTRIEIRKGRWEWLTDRAPVSFEHTAMMSVGWEYRINRSVLGTPLVVDGETFAHGIGVHSRSLLVYELGGSYAEFVSRFGFDRTAGPFASVEVTIRVDGRTCFSGTLSEPAALQGPVRIPVEGARTLELLVDFGENGAIQDRFDWIEPGLVRASAP